MDHYSFTDPLRDGWLSWPCWLTDSGRLNHKVVTHPASSLAQDRESSPAETSVLTTMLRRQRIDIMLIANLLIGLQIGLRRAADKICRLISTAGVFKMRCYNYVKYLGIYFAIPK